ncbi:hypothetical protein ACFYOT_32105 [Saccharothrix saharensis]
MGTGLLDLPLLVADPEAEYCAAAAPSAVRPMPSTTIPVARLTIVT